MKSLVLLAAVVACCSPARLPEDDQPNLIELAERLNLTEFVRLAKEAGVDRIINHEGMFTVFAPTDEAFASERRYPNEASVKDKMQFHVGRGLYMEKDIKDEATINSLLSHRKIRFNIYPNKEVTANGRAISSSDHLARNGVVHVLSSVMSSVYAREGSVVSELDECCPQHSEILSLVKVAGLYGKMDAEGPFTFLAPTNGAFSELHPDFINHLKKNVTKLRKFIGGHVVPLTWYSPGFQDGQTVTTEVGNKLRVRVSQGGTVKIGGAEVTLPDVTAGNGVVHVIDKVLFPEDHQHTEEEEDDNEVRVIAPNEIKSIGELEKKKNIFEAVASVPRFSKFSSYLRLSGVDRFLRDEQFKYTVLAPSNIVFEEMKRSLSPVELNRSLAHLFLSDEWSTSAMVEAGSVRTLGGRRLKVSTDAKGRLTLGSGPNPAVVLSGDLLSAANGVAHEVGGNKGWKALA